MSVGMAVPEVADKKEHLSLGELRALRQVSRWRAAVAIAWTWVLIAGFFVLMANWTSWWLLIIVSPILGALQNRLTTLLHDGMHRSLHPNPYWSDFLAKWFCACPSGNFFHTNLLMHAHHHHEFGEQHDPNVLAYTISKRTFLFRDLPKSLLMLGLVSAVFNFNQRLANRFRYSASQSAVDDPERRIKAGAMCRDYIQVAVVQLVLLGLFILAGTWWCYFYWLFVRVSWCNAFNTIRLFVEHHSDVSDAAPIFADTANVQQHLHVDTMAGFFERFFIAPLNFNLHGTHHVAPFIPFYQLPQIAKLCQHRGLNYVVNRKGYVRYLLGVDNYAGQERQLMKVPRLGHVRQRDHHSTIPQVGEGETV